MVQRITSRHNHVLLAIEVAVSSNFNMRLQFHSRLFLLA
jgi:hypothetical protein